MRWRQTSSNFLPFAKRLRRYGADYGPVYIGVARTPVRWGSPPIFKLRFFADVLPHFAVQSPLHRIKSSITIAITTLRKFTSASRVVKLYVNAGYFRPQLGGLPHLPEVPHIHVNRPFLGLGGSIVVIYSSLRSNFKVFILEKVISALKRCSDIL